MSLLVAVLIIIFMLQIVISGKEISARNNYTILLRNLNLIQNVLVALIVQFL